jgi:hypothetical protein
MKEKLKIQLIYESTGQQKKMINYRQLMKWRKSIKKNTNMTVIKLYYKPSSSSSSISSSSSSNYEIKFHACLFQQTQIYAICCSMRKAIQGGVVNYQDKLWQASKPPCMIKEEFVSVDMEKISPAFLIVGMGVVVAIIMLICEKVIKKSKYYNVDHPSNSQ